MKLYRFVFLFVLGLIAPMSLPVVQAQDDFAALPGEVTLYDEDAAYFGDLMSYFFGSEYAVFSGEDYLSLEPNGASIQAAAAAVSAPLNCHATQMLTSGSVSVSWGKPTMGTPSSYRVYIDGLRKVSTTSFSYTFSPGSITPGLHTAYVTAVDSYGAESSSSNIATVTVNSVSKPPTLLSVVQSGTGKVKLNWTYDSSATAYSVYRYTNGTWIKMWTGVGNFTGSGITITEVDATLSCPAGTHGFAVTTLSPGESAKSGMKTFTVK